MTKETEKNREIWKLEQRFRITLPLLKTSKIMGSTRGYAVNADGDVIGLNLDEVLLSDTSILQCFPRLTRLSLYRSRIFDVSGLVGLTDLIMLDLDDNQIVDVSKLKKLKRLEELYLRKNRITDILPILELENLKNADLSHNAITHLPIVTRERIEKDRMEIKWGYGVSSRGLIILEGNPMESPPVEIVRRGTLAVLNYLKELEQSVLLLQAKLLFVGGGEVGKTTLMRTLIEPDFQLKKQDVGKEPSTHGICIRPWQLTCQLEKDTESSRQLTLHVWDFGGQEIYLSTHQFFLTKRSLYIFVWEARKEEETQAFDYWLNVIRLLSEESPVIVVMNKEDVRSKPIDEAAYSDKFKSIETFHQVSCLTCKGVEELEQTIRQVLGRMPHLKDELPKTWSTIRNALDSEQRDYITSQRYYEICSSFGLDRERADHLGDYLHDLGAILRFRTDPVLRKILVLKPEWATEAVYKLIDTREILDNKGRFDYGHLEHIWDSFKYPLDKHHELIRLMEKFELCFNFSGTATYIVPELVPAQRPQIEVEFLHADALRFQYSYDFMPKGIVSRFIARNYYLIDEENFWKNGVKLRFEESLALVTGEPSRRRLNVRVRGAQKNELLAIIRNELNHIHHTLNLKRKKNHYTEEVPCNCFFCRNSEQSFLFPFRKLEKLAKLGKKPLCMESYENISPAVLLGRYEPPKPELSLLEALKACLCQLQGKALDIHAYENSRNGFVAQLLKARGFLVEEQVLWGLAPSGENLGELDMKINDPTGETLGIAEAFNLSCLDRNVISKHLKKIFGYDPHGLQENFILVYVESKSFKELWGKYFVYLDKVDYPFKLKGKQELMETELAELKCARTIHDRQGKETTLYHLFVHMPVREDGS